MDARVVVFSTLSSAQLKFFIYFSLPSMRLTFCCWLWPLPPAPCHYHGFPVTPVTDSVLRRSKGLHFCCLSGQRTFEERHFPLRMSQSDLSHYAYAPLPTCPLILPSTINLSSCLWSFYMAKALIKPTWLKLLLLLLLPSPLLWKEFKYPPWQPPSFLFACAPVFVQVNRLFIEYANGQITGPH